jgi:hypothetical protein
MRLRLDYGDKDPERKSPEFGGDFEVNEIVRTNAGLKTLMHRNVPSEDWSTDVKRHAEIEISAKELAEILISNLPSK